MACKDKSEWNQDAVFVINGSKSELLGINYQPNARTVAGPKLINKTIIKILGLRITQDIKWNLHVKNCVIKLDLQPIK